MKPLSMIIQFTANDFSLIEVIKKIHPYLYSTQLMAIQAIDADKVVLKIL